MDAAKGSPLRGSGGDMYQHTSRYGLKGADYSAASMQTGGPCCILLLLHPHEHETAAHMNYACCHVHDACGPALRHLIPTSLLITERNLKPPRRKQAINSLIYGANPSNPFEAVVEAVPAVRHMGPARNWQQLELMLPSGCSRAVVSELETQLAHFLHDNTSASGARVDRSPPRSPLVTGVPLPNSAAAAAAAASYLTAAATAAQATSGGGGGAAAWTGSAAVPPPAAYGGLPPPSPTGAFSQAQGTWSPKGFSVQGSFTAEASMAGLAGGQQPVSGPNSAAASRLPSPPRARAVSLDEGSRQLQGAGAEGEGGGVQGSPPRDPRPTAPVEAGTTLQPLQQAAALRYGSAAGLLPPVGAMQPAQIPPSMLGATANAQHAHLLQAAGLAGVTLGPLVGNMPAGYTQATANAGAVVAGTALQPGEHVTLGKLVSERQSVRRHVQLVGEWLEGTVARLWAGNTQAIEDIQMRSVFAASNSNGKGKGAGAGGAQGEAMVLPRRASDGMVLGETLSVQPSQASGIGLSGGEGVPSASVFTQKGMSGAGAGGDIHTVLAAMAPNPFLPAAFDPATKKAGLAAKFASFVSTSLMAHAQLGGSGAAYHASMEMWQGLLQVRETA